MFDLIRKYWFLAGLLLVFAVTVADSTQMVSGIGRWLKMNHGPDTVIVLIFFFSGLMLNAGQIKSVLIDIKGILVALTIIFLVAPVFAALIGTAILALGATYYIYSSSSSLIEQIKKLNNDTKKINQIISQSNQLQIEEQKIREILDKNPNFNMSTYFQRFYTKHNIKPEAGWKPEPATTIEGLQGDAKYQEVVLQAMFKKQTMQKLVTLLQVPIP